MIEDSTNKNIVIHPNSTTSKSSTYECISYKLLPKSSRYATVITAFKGHTLKHLDVKPSKNSSNCNHCEATFRTKETLNEHILQKHPTFIESVTSKVHECKICNFKTTIKNRLNNHLVQHPETKADCNTY
nr:unnamed protein product [Callosobruchus analis]